MALSTTTSQPQGRVHVRIVRYRYLHVFASEESVKAKSTDPETLERICRAINKANLKGEIVRHHDIAQQLHGICVQGLDAEKNYRLAWWMFRTACDEGWEPMETGEHMYKLKYQETAVF